MLSGAPGHRYPRSVRSSSSQLDCPVSPTTPQSAPPPAQNQHQKKRRQIFHHHSPLSLGNACMCVSEARPLILLLWPNNPPPQTISSPANTPPAPHAFQKSSTPSFVYLHPSAAVVTNVRGVTMATNGVPNQVCIYSYIIHNHRSPPTPYTRASPPCYGLCKQRKAARDEKGGGWRRVYI